jgi:hypothetical protein
LATAPTSLAIQKSDPACLYKLFMDSLQHLYAAARNISLLIICLPKLLTDIAKREGQRGGTRSSRERETWGAS